MDCIVWTELGIQVLGRWWMEIPDDFNVGFCRLQTNTVDCCIIWVFDASGPNALLLSGFSP